MFSDFRIVGTDSGRQRDDSSLVNDVRSPLWLGKHAALAKPDCTSCQDGLSGRVLLRPLRPGD